MNQINTIEQKQTQEFNVGLTEELWEELCECVEQGQLNRVRNKDLIMTIADVIPKCIHSDFMSAMRELDSLLRRGMSVDYAEDDIVRIGIWASLYLDVFELSDTELDDLALSIRDIRNPLYNVYRVLYWRNEIPVDEDYLIQEILNCTSDAHCKDINKWINTP